MFSCECDTMELVRKAQLGDKDSLNRLAETVRVRLHQYVFRLTLAEDLTQDIVQETILEMLRLFGKLRRIDRFWGWLYGIAFNKVRSHYGKQWRHKTRSLSDNPHEPQAGPGGDVLAELVTEELKQIVLRSIEALEPRHRAVLTMRCYDHMSYAQIGEMIGCSEVGTRALFYRAKKALTHQLSGHGLDRGALVLALLVFGKLTAASEAAAAEVSVTAATVSVGPLGSLLGMATGKTGLVTLATAGVLVAGSAAITFDPVASRLGLHPGGPDGLPAAPWGTELSKAEQERWYYFPEGPDGALMRRVAESDDSPDGPRYLVLENQYANYHFDHKSNTVYIRNYRCWEEDLRVTRLPTDSPALNDFIGRIEGRPYSVDRVTDAHKGLLAICRRTGSKERMLRQIDQHLNVLEEEYFRVSWPESARLVDERDPMHQRGRTLMRIDGRINGVPVSGTGRLPLVYAASRLHWPWLDLRLGRRLRAVDTKAGAIIYDRNGRVVERYAAGSLFAGLARPWMGLHAIDTIRRDAAQQQLPFETQYDHRQNRARIIVHGDSVTLTYTIDMETDVVEHLAFSPGRIPGENPMQGELTFTYIQNIGNTETEFAEPRVSARTTAEVNPNGMQWLIQWLRP